MKKLVQAAIAKKLFEIDPTYGTIYASNQEKIALAVQSSQFARLKSTGAGISAGDPAHQNLMHELHLS
ncbi:hypothetical protein PAXRUDRAFT_793813 [Paxillus rubicundulus Ve08.2h10]|uniref:Uncharacterized protein n=1 Tax=Paxillus rubicundulus Ve08.2h10 TaxID=930991 RepID=A0A0D0DLM6_9AGAM|nr:hypothetical protein PAXRUDRAFT_793813 [Paxillus rubicundulus Ve08.2h10]